MSLDRIILSSKRDELEVASSFKAGKKVVKKDPSGSEMDAKGELEEVEMAEGVTPEV